MAYELIPGVQQDHRGRTYQFGRYPNGKLIQVPCTVPPLSAKTAALLEPVLVQSQSTLTLNKDKELEEKPNLEWVEQALLKGSLHARGQLFESLACFQRKGEG